MGEGGPKDEDKAFVDAYSGQLAELLKAGSAAIQERKPELVANAATALFSVAALRIGTPEIAVPAAAAAFGKFAGEWLQKHDATGRLQSLDQAYRDSAKRRRALEEVAEIIRPLIAETISVLTTREASQLGAAGSRGDFESAVMDALWQVVRETARHNESDRALQVGLAHQRAEHAEHQAALQNLQIGVHGLTQRVAALALHHESVAATPLGDAELIANYKGSLRVTKARPLGIFANALSEMDTVFVELDIGTEAGVWSRDEAKLTGLTLRQLMERTLLELQGGPESPPGRWVVLGSPGSGKTTLARHLAWELANVDPTDKTKSDKDNSPGALKDKRSLARLAKARPQPIPVYVSLPQLAKEGKHPFEIVEDRLRAARGSHEAAGLSRALFERCNIAKSAEPIWLLLDGLDEVAPEHWDPIQEQLNAWAAACNRSPRGLSRRS